MKEEYIHYIWKYGTFDASGLLTTEGEEIEILSKGMLNSNAGPDFLNAKIKIGKTIWAGNVEMHLRSSDWERHLHQNDPAYDNVILHVVVMHDKDILNSKGNTFPTLSLSSRISTDHFGQYKKLVGNKESIACSELVGSIDPFIVNTMKEKAVVNRLERKTKIHLEDLERTGNDWQQLLYEMLAGNFGFKINSAPFEELAKRTPLNILLKHINDPLQIEAIVFGQAGFLESEIDEKYPVSLKREYQFLKQKYDLKPLSLSSWKFMRMRPANFPTIRLAQFAAYLIKNRGLTEFDFKGFNKDDWKHSFEITINNYWDTHYRFGEPSKLIKKQFGISSFNNIVINTICRFLFVQGVYLQNDKLKERGLGLLLAMPTEDNSIITKWKEIGVSSKNSCDSQSLLELKNEWCDRKRCLNCVIGNHVMKTLSRSR